MMNNIYFSENRSIFISDVENVFSSSPFLTEIKIYDGPYTIEYINETFFTHIESKVQGNVVIDIFEYRGIIITRFIENIKKSFKTYVKIENKSKKKIRVCKLTSLYLNGVFKSIDDATINNDIVHYFRSSWCAEGQRCSKNLNELYLPIVNNRDSQTYYDFISETSYSTGTYFPTFFFVDRNNNNTVALLIEPKGRWQVRLAYIRKPYFEDKTLSISTFTGAYNTCDFYVDLEEGESYQSINSVFSIGKDITESLKNINEYKRSKREKNQNLVIFNDYMNCLWAKPNSKNTIPLIDKTSELGVDVYCMDSGWYKVNNESDWFGVLGDWEKNDDLFIGFGLEGIINHARSNNLKFGLWFELEACTPNSIAARREESWFLHLDGKRILEKNRYFFDVRNKEVREYLVNKVYKYYKMGIRYIKNDYNSSFYGCDSSKGGKIFGLEEYIDGVSTLYKEIKEKCKGLIIENCASGAMRSDELLHENTFVQSFSDCEDYIRYPSIIKGSLVNVLPEQLGVWSVIYPFKLDFNEKTFPTKEYIQSQLDGESTIFSLVNAFMGRMYLSGRLNAADKKNLELTKEAIDLYHKYFNFIAKSNPVINESNNYFKKEGIIVQELEFEDKSLLAVWHLAGGENTYVVNAKDVKVVFPKDDSYNRGIISQKGLYQTVLKLEKDFQARLFEIKK